MTEAERHARASLLFLELRERSAAERDAALAAAATGDVGLAAEVASLLAHDAHDEPALPGHVGPYRIVSRLGSGGSGQVFLAEQEQPIRRRVAIKVVPQAAVSPELAARFEVERRALECTDHPNIARVLDAGRTPDGLPYLVMNFVDGERITDHCTRRALPLTARVRLAIVVADAVQHAHQRGVIHRDLKPANILVTESDGRAVPQVLDFGIAKPVAGALLADSPPTLGLPLGTPAYMAPEQTGLLPVDTRADVYALGAVLYELVTGLPPLEVGGDPLAALQRIRDSIPAPASSVRERQGARAAPGPVSRAFLADLDLVLSKALEKQPDRRYASVEAFADDLRRLLACEPVAARAPGLRYRAARFARRNRVLVMAGLIVLAALGAGVVGLVTGLLEARRQGREALSQNDAQREINRFLTDDLLAEASPDRGGPDLTALDLLNRASARVEQRFPNRPLIAAAIHHTLGEAYAQLGEFDAAENHLDRAVTLRHAAAGADSPDAVHSEIAAASLLGRRERLDEARAALVPAIGRARLILGPDDSDLYTALNDLGVVLLGLDRTDEALDVLQEALAGRRRLLGEGDPQVVESLNNLAQVRDQQGDTEGALALLRQALLVAEALPDEPRLTVLGLHNNIGATLQDLDRNEEAEPHVRRAAEMAGELLGPEHPATLTIEGNLAGLEADLGQLDVALEMFRRVIAGQTVLLGPAASDTLTARYGYWNAMWKAHRCDEAAAGFDELLHDVSAALGADHWLSAQTEASLARALLDAGRSEQALPHAEHALARFQALYGPDHARTRGVQQTLDALRGS
ncbi:MAG TPA: serine/threonine-protein kinase [Planctomycetota bacterium]|nr:serine/threonine-protein kinase [Planctomycetota bacterium]